MRVAILNRFHLRLNRLHLAHGDDAAMTWIKQNEIQQDRERNDRPPVITDIATAISTRSTAARPSRKHAEVDGPDQLGIGSAQQVELLGADVKRTSRGGSRNFNDADSNWVRLLGSAVLGTEIVRNARSGHSRC